MLDSSPVALPPIPRPLKRSASTASLPTPPRTHHKRKNRGSRALHDTDTELDSSANEDEEDVTSSRQKKRRTSEANETEEEAFWMDSKTKSDSELEPKLSSKLKSTSPAPLLYRRHLNATNVAPVSPPPSNRKTTTTTTTPTVVASVPASPPVTPPPLRDSPNNPFLVTPTDDTADSAATSPGPRTPLKERATVTYVFRGVRGTFPNPLYDQERNRPLSPSAKSRLPPEHPDFSPSQHCPPKLLFPGARRSARKGTTIAKHRTLGTELEQALGKEKGANTKGHNRRRSVSFSGSESESDGEQQLIVPKKLDFAGELRDVKKVDSDIMKKATGSSRR